MWTTFEPIRNLWTSFAPKNVLLPEVGQDVQLDEGVTEKDSASITFTLLLKMTTVCVGTVVGALFFKQAFCGFSGDAQISLKKPDYRLLTALNTDVPTNLSINEALPANLYPVTDIVSVMSSIPYPASVLSIPVAIFQDSSGRDVVMFTGENWNSDSGNRNYFQPEGFNKTEGQFNNYTVDPIKLSDKYYSYPWAFSLPQAERFMVGYSVFIQQVKSDGTYYLGPYEYSGLVETEAAFGFKCVSYEDNGKLPVTCVWTERDYSKIDIMTLNGYDKTDINTPKRIANGFTASMALFDNHVKGVAFGDKSGTCGAASVVLAVQFFDKDNNPLGDKTCLGNPNVTAISLFPTIMRVNGPTGEVAIVTCSSSAPIPYSGEGQTMVYSVNPSTRQPLKYKGPAFSSEYNSQGSIGYRPYYAAAVLSDGETVVIANSYQSGDKKAGVYAVTGAWNGTDLLLSEPVQIYDQAITGQVQSAAFPTDKRIVFTFPKDGAPAAIVYSSDQSALTPLLTEIGIPTERGQNTTVTEEYLQATVGGVPKAEIVFYPNCSHGLFLKDGLPVDNFTQADVTQGRIIFSHDGGWDPSVGDITCAYNNRTSTAPLNLPFDPRAYPPEWVLPTGQVIYIGKEITVNGTEWLILGDFSPAVKAVNATQAGGDLVQKWMQINFQEDPVSGRGFLLLKWNPPIGVDEGPYSWVLIACNNLDLCKSATLTMKIANFPSEPSQFQAWLLDAVKIGGSAIGLIMTGGTIAFGAAQFLYRQQKNARELKGWRKGESEFAERVRKKLNVWGYKNLKEYPQFKCFAEKILDAISRRDGKKWADLSEVNRAELVKRVVQTINELYRPPMTHLPGIRLWKFSPSGKSVFKLPDAESDAMGLMVTNIAGKVSTTNLRSSSVCIRVESEHEGKDEEMSALKNGCERSSEEESENSYVETSVESGGAEEFLEASSGSVGFFEPDSSLFNSRDRTSQDSLTSVESETSVSSTGSNMETSLLDESKKVSRKYKPKR